MYSEMNNFTMMYHKKIIYPKQSKISCFECLIVHTVTRKKIADI